MNAHTLLATMAWASAGLQAAPQSPVPTARSVTIALMDFESKAPGNADFGRQIAEVLTIRLSLLDGITVVERQKLKDVLAEQKLRLSGLSATDQATQVGKLLGAEIVIFGQSFPVGDELYVPMKLVAAETAALKGVIVRAPMTEELADVLDRAGEELAKALQQHLPALVPRPAAELDPIEAWRARLGDRRRPTVAVIVPETHVQQVIPDPAAETEIKRLLLRLGCEVRAVKDEATQKWARNMKGSKDHWPDTLADVDLVVMGEAFSERAAAFDGRVSCTARLEVSVVERLAGKLLEADRTTERAVDLSEQIAAKSALQKCGHVVGQRLADVIGRRVLEQNP